MTHHAIRAWRSLHGAASRQPAQSSLSRAHAASRSRATQAAARAHRGCTARGTAAPDDGLPWTARSTSQRSSDASGTRAAGSSACVVQKSPRRRASACVAPSTVRSRASAVAWRTVTRPASSSRSVDHLAVGVDVHTGEPRAAHHRVDVVRVGVERFVARVAVRAGGGTDGDDGRSGPSAARPQRQAGERRQDAGLDHSASGLIHVSLASAPR